MDIFFYNLFFCVSLHCFYSTFFRNDINKELPLLVFSVIRINKAHTILNFTLAQKTGNSSVSNLINVEQIISTPLFFERPSPSPSPFTFKALDLSPFQQYKPIFFDLSKTSPFVSAKKTPLIQQKCKYELITRHYPKKLLKVKESESIRFFHQEKLLKMLLLLFLLFIFFILVKKVLKEILQAKPNKNLNLKQKIGSKGESKVKATLRLKMKLGYLNDFIIKTGALFLQKVLLMEHLIYLDKIQENRNENTVFASCRHFFVDIKKGETIILTRNVPNFGIYLGMIGQVEKVLINQRIEIGFFYDSRFSCPTIKNKLSSYPTFIIKDKDFI